MDKKTNFVQGMYPEHIHFNMIQESTESADKRIAKAVAGKGIVFGFNFSIGNDIAYITEGEAFDGLGRQVHHSGDDIEIDLSGITRPTTGNWKWVSFYVSFITYASGDVYDDSNVRHDLYHEETVSAHFIEGEEGTEEEAGRPDIGDNVLVAEILIDSSASFASFTPSLSRRASIVPASSLKMAIDDIVASNSPIISKKNPFSYDENIIVVRRNSIYATLPGWKQSFFTDIELSENNLDTGNFEVGKDYYIQYVYQNGTGNLIISLNATYQNGVKIGGFHYGHVRKVSGDGLWLPIDGTGNKWGNSGGIWWDNVIIGIIPNSVWDLKNRPKCNPAGMVKVGKFWIDIYAVSEAETIMFCSSEKVHIRSGKLQTKYGIKPISGGSLSYFAFNELAMMLEKRLPRYIEIIFANFGSPIGLDDNNDYGFTAITNSYFTYTGCNVNPDTGVYDPINGIKPYAISAYNISDPVGNVRCLTSDLTANPELQGGWNWWDALLGQNMGGLYSPHPLGLLVVAAGASWNDGIHGGQRTTYLHPISDINQQFGCRFVCDAL